MRDYSFSSFLVDDNNRRAYDLCLAVARSQPLSPLPITLVAEAAAGKSHLLRAIANRLRASAGHAAIVYLAPAQAADEIDRLVADPAPIDMARYAVLLIDDLDRFDDQLDSLTRLVEIFLENDHPVVAAMSVHPERMAPGPARLRRLLLGGQVVVIEPGQALQTVDRLEARIREESQDAFRKLQHRIDELEAGGPATADRTPVRAAQLEKMRRQLEEARNEIEHLRGENALLGASTKEAETLRARIHTLEEERQKRLEQPAQAAPQDEAPELKRKLDEARFDAQRAREEARGMLQRAETLLQDLQKNRTEFETAQRESKLYRTEIKKLESIFSGENLTLDEISQEGEGGARELDTPESEPAEAAPPPDLPDDELTALREELHILRDEFHRLQESVVRAHAERDSAKSHLARVRDELEETRRDLLAARDESERLLAERNQRIVELEQALIDRQDEYDRLQEAQDDIANELVSLQSQLSEGTDVLERLMELFGIPPEELERLAGASRENRGPAESPDSDSDDEETAAGQAAEDQRNAGHRDDFGEGLRLVPRPGGPSLHHVEELRAGLEALLPDSLPPLDDSGDDDEPMFGTRPKTA